MPNQQSDLHARVYDRLVEHLGEPAQSREATDQWSIRPYDYAITIIVFLKLSSEGPAVWVFGPHDPAWRTLITCSDDIERAIRAIFACIKREVERGEQLAMT